MTETTTKRNGLVAKVVNERRLILNIGSADDIMMEDTFVVFCLEEEIFDPETKESLGKLENIKGKGKVVHVQAHICTIETYEVDMMTTPPTRSISLFGTAKENFYRKFVGVEVGDYARKTNVFPNWLFGSKS